MYKKRINLSFFKKNYLKINKNVKNFNKKIAKR